MRNPRLARVGLRQNLLQKENKTDLAITYLLDIYLKKQKCIKVGKLGTFRFKNGYYVYVGSAKKNMAKRIARHLRKKKKKFWHIDYLLQYAEVKKVWTSDLPEEKMAELLAEKMTAPVLGFGASDKKSKTHLFYCKRTR
jgi:sugar fermentation stimulation protein A